MRFLRAMCIVALVAFMIGGAVAYFTGNQFLLGGSVFIVYLVFGILAFGGLILEAKKRRQRYGPPE